ncbi:hypothetical protein GCM10020331_083240 [Ectobacillus funiculus]
MALETVYISANLIKGLTEEKGESFLISIYRRAITFKKIGHATQSVEASIASEIEGKHLNIRKGSPLLLLQRKTYLGDGTTLEVVKILLSS